jgi:hypothetical protein
LQQEEIGMLHLIKDMKEAEPFFLTLCFNTGETLHVDLTEKLQEWSQSPNSKFRVLLQPEYFRSVKWDPEMETVYWENGIDLCPDVLYEIGSRQEGALA